MLLSTEAIATNPLFARSIHAPPTHTSALHAVNNGPTELHTLHKPTLLVPNNPEVTIPWVVSTRLTFITISSKAKEGGPDPYYNPNKRETENHNFQTREDFTPAIIMPLGILTNYYFSSRKSYGESPNRIPKVKWGLRRGLFFLSVPSPPHAAS